MSSRNRSSSPLRSRARQRGVALIIAMLVFALAATLVVAMSSEFTLFLKRGANSVIATQNYAYLLGGEDLAKMVLVQDAEEDQLEGGEPRDDLSELWAQEVPPYTLDEGGFLLGSLEDLSGRLNINTLAATPAEGQQFTSTQAQFLRLLQSFEEPRVNEQDARLILEALQDWLDGDQVPRDFGAEDDYYFDREPSYRTANRQMQSVSELRMVAYMTEELFLAVEPYLTVWSSGAINIQTAPAQVLRTLNADNNLEPLSEGEGEALVELRGDEGYESVEDFLASPVLAGVELSADLRNRLVESSDTFLYRGQVEVAGRTATMYSVLRREGDQVKTLVRAAGSL